MSVDIGSYRFLVTGASGFVGTRLVENLIDRGAFVACLSMDWDPNSRFIQSGIHHRVENIKGSVEDHALLLQLLRKHEIDTVVHLAAVALEGQAFASPMAAFDVNIRGTYSVLEACRQSAAKVERIVVASSDKAYGDHPILPYTEDMALMGRHPYDVSKSCADLIAQAYNHSYGLPVAISRFANVFGPGDLNWSRLIPGTIRRLHHGEQPVIRMPPEGSFKRDFIHVDDAVSGLTSLVGGLADPAIHGQAFNFGLGGSFTVLEVVQAIQRRCGREDIEPLFIPQKHGEIRQQQVAIEKAKRLLGWAPRRSLEAGLDDTVPWYQKILAA